MALELKKVSKRIHRAQILQDIDLVLEPGIVYGLWGKNGCGKTMLMRVMSGLIRPTEGHVYIDGKELGKDMDFPDSIGLLLENPAFLNSYTGYENLAALAEIKGRIGEARIREVLTQVGLDPEDQRKYRKYSLGMKQRLGIACALMEEPDIILLDEPINAIDENGAEEIKKLIVAMKEKGKIVVVACHDREDLKFLADQVIYMSEGKITKIEAIE